MGDVHQLLPVGWIPQGDGDSGPTWGPVATPSRVGDFPRTLDQKFDKLPTVSIKDFGADVGATGDGVTRKLSAATVAAKTTFGFSGSNRLDNFDTEDTEDWLSAALAVKHLASKGGGTLYVPRPESSYILRRFIPIPAGVPIRILGDGFSSEINDFDNTTDLTGGWQNIERRYVFQPQVFKMQSLVDGGSGACTQVAMAVTAVGHTSIIPLAVGGGATFAVGNRVVIYTTGNFASGASVCPYRLCFRRVIDVSTDTLLLDEPIPFYLAAGTGRVAKMGTGSDTTYNTAPYDFVEDFVVEGITARGSALLGGGSAGRNCRLENFRFTADRAATSSDNGGLQMNGWVDTTVKNFEILTNNRGLEIKLGSGGQWNHLPDEERGGTGLLVAEGVIRLIGASTADAPLVSIGEGANCKLRNLSLVRGANGYVTQIKVSDSEVVVMRGINLDLYGGDDSAATAFEVVGHHSPQDRTIVDIRGVRMGGEANKWKRCLTANGATDRPYPNLIYGDLKVVPTIGATFETSTFVLTTTGHSSVFNIQSEVGETLGFAGSSIAPSPIEGVLGATATEIGSIADWINTSYKRLGRSVYDTTNNRLYFPIGRLASSKWRPYDDMSGGTDVTPV